MTQFLQLVVSGLAMGCVLGLIALGFTLIYKATETVNFARGDLMMLGGFVALTVVAMIGLPIWLGVLVVAIVYQDDDYGTDVPKGTEQTLKSLICLCARRRATSAAPPISLLRWLR
jgi:hypothetical protein